MELLKIDVMTCFRARRHNVMWIHENKPHEYKWLDVYRSTQANSFWPFSLLCKQLTILHIIGNPSAGYPHAACTGIHSHVTDCLGFCSVSTPCCALISLYTPHPEYPDHAEATVFSSPFTGDWQPIKYKSLQPMNVYHQCVCVCWYVMCSLKKIKN